MKEKTLREKLNFKTHIVQLESHDNDDMFVLELESIIRTWNQDSTIHGILVQLPLPERLKQYQSGLLKLISRQKMLMAFYILTHHLFHVLLKQLSGYSTGMM